MFNFEIENNTIKFTYNFYYAMQIINKIKKYNKIFILLFLGLLQANNQKNIELLLLNKNISNRTHHIYTQTKGAIQMFTVSDKNQFVKIWEYWFIEGEETEVVKMLADDITGNGQNELVVLVNNFNTGSKIYVFSMIKNEPTGLPEIYELSSLEKGSIPGFMKALKWDGDKDKEIAISFSSPSRQIVVFDYISNSLQPVQKVGEELLSNTYGPVEFLFADVDNNKQEDFLIYSNNDFLQHSIHFSDGEEEKVEINPITTTLKQFMFFKKDNIINEIAINQKQQLYNIKENKPIFLKDKFLVFDAHKLKKNKLLLYDGNQTIQTAQLNGSQIESLEILTLEITAPFSLNVSQNKKEAIAYNAENNEFVLIDLNNLENKTITEKNKKTEEAQNKKNEEVVERKTEEPKTIEQNETVDVLPAETKPEEEKQEIAQDTLYVNQNEKISIPLKTISGLLFKDLKTKKKPTELKLNQEKLSFEWTPTEKEINQYELQYQITYQTPPKIIEKTVDNQLEVSTTAETQINNFETVLFVNAKPQIKFENKQDTVLVNHFFETKYEIVDKNKKDKHTLKALNTTTHPLIFDENKITWQTDPKEAGLNVFQIEVSDQRSSQIFDLEIFVDTTKKEFQYNNRVVTEVNKELIYNIPYKDGDQFNLIDAPENLRINRKGRVNWIPIMTQIDNNNIHIEIVNEGNKKNYFLQIYVNVPPVISYRPMEREHIYLEDSFEFGCQSFDMNQEANINWNVQTKENQNMAISNEGKITFQDSLAIDNIDYLVELSDGISQTDFSGVLYINSLPKIISKPQDYVELGDTLKYTVEVEDLNNEAPFSSNKKNKIFFNMTKSPSSATLDSTGNLFWVPQETEIGLNKFVVEVFDSLDYDKQVFEVFVNDQPSFVSSDSLSIELGDTLKHLFSVQDLNKNSELVYSIKTSLDEITFSKKTGILTWIPTIDDLGTHQLEISVSDGFNENSGDSQKLKIFVYKNPEFLNTPNLEAFVNTEYKYSPSVIDLFGNEIFGNNIQYFSPDSLNTAQFNEETNELIWVPGIKEEGKHKLIFDIQDDYQNSVVKEFNVKVLLSPCEPGAEIIDTVFQTQLDSIIIEKIDSVLIEKTDTLFIEKTDTIKINEKNEIIQDPVNRMSIQYKKSPFERNKKLK